MGDPSGDARGQDGKQHIMSFSSPFLLVSVDEAVSQFDRAMEEDVVELCFGAS